MNKAGLFILESHLIEYLFSLSIITKNERLALTMCSISRRYRGVVSYSDIAGSWDNSSVFSKGNANEKNPSRKKALLDYPELGNPSDPLGRDLQGSDRNLLSRARFFSCMRDLTQLRNQNCEPMTEAEYNDGRTPRGHDPHPLKDVQGIDLYMLENGFDVLGWMDSYADNLSTRHRNSGGDMTVEMISSVLNLAAYNLDRDFSKMGVDISTSKINHQIETLATEKAAAPKEAVSKKNIPDLWVEGERSVENRYFIFDSICINTELTKRKNLYFAYRDSDLLLEIKSKLGSDVKESALKRKMASRGAEFNFQYGDKWVPEIIGFPVSMGSVPGPTGGLFYKSKFIEKSMKEIISKKKDFNKLPINVVSEMVRDYGIEKYLTEGLDAICPQSRIELKEYLKEASMRAGTALTVAGIKISPESVLKLMK